MSRTRDEDACPGALTVHQAADGALARIRIPGGVITATQLEALAETALQFAAGTLDLTGRGNLQLRGITDTAAVAEAVAAAGLLPSPRHETVRNIVASPLSGRVGGLADIRPWVGELDRAIRDAPELAGLTGRFLFSIDDGTGDVSGLAADAGVQVLADGVALLLAGRDTGVRLGHDEAIPALIAIARRFTEMRGNAWRINELTEPAMLLDGWDRTEPTLVVTPVTRGPVGWIEQSAAESGEVPVTLGAAVPLGVLTARQAQFVAAIDAPVVITPWRSLLVCDLEEGVADASLRVLAPLGLVFDAASRWLDVSSCVGSPGCERSRGDVRAEAARAAATGSGTGRVHYVGCERACGKPVVGQVLIANGTGYEPHPAQS